MSINDQFIYEQDLPEADATVRKRRSGNRLMRIAIQDAAEDGIAEETLRAMRPVTRNQLLIGCMVARKVPKHDIPSARTFRRHFNGH